MSDTLEDFHLSHLGPRKKIPRPEAVPCITRKQRTGHHDMYVTVGYLEEGIPYEVFINIEDSDQCERGFLEALGRVLSIALGYGVPVEELINQLNGIRCVPVSDPFRGRMIKSPADGVARVLEDFIS